MWCSWDGRKGPVCTRRRITRDLSRLSVVGPVRVWHSKCDDWLHRPNMAAPQRMIVCVDLIGEVGGPPVFWLTVRKHAHKEQIIYLPFVVGVTKYVSWNVIHAAKLE